MFFDICTQLVRAGQSRQDLCRDRGARAHVNAVHGAGDRSCFPDFRHRARYSGSQEAPRLKSDLRLHHDLPSDWDKQRHLLATPCSRPTIAHIAIMRTQTSAALCDLDPGSALSRTRHNALNLLHNEPGAANGGFESLSGTFISPWLHVSSEPYADKQWSNCAVRPSIARASSQHVAAGRPH